jgi:hypothetical protein
MDRKKNIVVVLKARSGWQMQEIELFRARERFFYYGTF